MMANTNKTLGLLWLGAVAMALSGVVAFGAACLVPLPAEPLPPIAPQVPWTPSPAEIFGALTGSQRTALRDEIGAVRTLLDHVPDASAEPVAQARARLAALLQAQDRAVTETPPAMVLSSIVSRIDGAVGVIQQAAERQVATSRLGLSRPGALLSSLAGRLVLATIAFSFLAALLALVAGRPTLSIRRRAGRPGTWITLGSPEAARPVLSPGLNPVLPVLTDEAGRLRALAEAMAQLVRESGAELSRLRGDSQEQVDDAVMVSARLSSMALDAEARLQAGVERLEQAVDHVGRRGGPPPADRLERALPELLAALERVATPPDAAPALAARLADSAASLDRTAHSWAAMGASLRDVLPGAAERIESATAELARLAEGAARAAASRTLEVVQALPAGDPGEAASRFERASDALLGLAEDASRAAGLAAGRIDAALAALDRGSGLAAAQLTQLSEAAALTAATAATLPHAAARIEGVVAELTRGAGAASSQLEGLGEAAMRTSAAAAALPRVTARIEAAAAELGRGTGVAAAQIDGLREAANRTFAAAAALPEATIRMEGAVAELDRGAALAAARIDTLNEVASRAAAATAALPEATSRLGDAVTRLDRNTADAVAGLDRLADVASRVQPGLETLTGSAERIAHATGELADRTADYRLQGEALDAVIARNGDSCDALRAAATSGVERAVAALDRGAAEAAARLDGLMEAAGQASAAAAALPGAANDISLAVATLDQCTLEAVGKLGILGDAAERAAAATSVLPVESARLEQAAQALAERLERSLQETEAQHQLLDTAARRAEAAASSLPEAVSVVAMFAAEVEGKAGGISAQLDAATGALDREVGRAAERIEGLVAASRRAEEATLTLPLVTAQMEQVAGELDRTAAAARNQREGLAGATEDVLQAAARLPAAVSDIADASEGMTRAAGDVAHAAADLARSASVARAPLEAIDGAAARTTEVASRLGTLEGRLEEAVGRTLAELATGRDAIGVRVADLAAAVTRLDEAAGLVDRTVVEAREVLGNRVPETASRMERSAAGLAEAAAIATQSRLATEREAAALGDRLSKAVVWLESLIVTTPETVRKAS